MVGLPNYVSALPAAKQIPAIRRTIIESHAIPAGVLVAQAPRNECDPAHEKSQLGVYEELHRRNSVASKAFAQNRITLYQSNPWPVDHNPRTLILSAETGAATCPLRKMPTRGTTNIPQPLLEQQI